MLGFSFIDFMGSRALKVKVQGLPKVRSLIGDLLFIILGPKNSLSSE